MTDVGRARPFLWIGLVGATLLAIIAVAVAILGGMPVPTSPTATNSPTATVSEQ